jgi:predicted nucleic acid-binding protein
MPFVIDNSVVCAWFLSNQASEYAEGIAQRLLDDHAHAPAVWPLELANVLRTACRRGALTAEQAQGIAADVAVLAIEIDHEPPSAGELLALAQRYDLSSYDAAYLELALRLQLPVATQDAALNLAAMSAGVGVV